MVYSGYLLEPVKATAAELGLSCKGPPAKRDTMKAARLFVPSRQMTSSRRAQLGKEARAWVCRLRGHQWMQHRYYEAGSLAGRYSLCGRCKETRTDPLMMTVLRHRSASPATCDASATTGGVPQRQANAAIMPLDATIKRLRGGLSIRVSVSQEEVTLGKEAVLHQNVHIRRLPGPISLLFVVWDRPMSRRSR